MFKEGLTGCASLDLMGRTSATQAEAVNGPQGAFLGLLRGFGQTMIVQRARWGDAACGTAPVAPAAEVADGETGCAALALKGELTQCRLLPPSHEHVTK